MSLNDSDQRTQAIDPSRSFIVQAPAGSGKTEILTQRYLRLLSIVDSPEQIIALTFTRKAANEMRERILLALQQAALGRQALSAHQQTTFALARNALARDKTLDWQLLQQPSRLRIITIDSLCQTLTQAIPLQAKQIHYADISDKPMGYYLAASRACLDFAINNEAYHQPLKRLLHHLDNRQDKLFTLFSELLAKRDQWLQPLYQAKTQEQAMYEQGIAWILEHELARFRQTVPLDYASELVILARRLACIEAKPDSPRYLLRDWLSFDQLDGRLVTSLSTLLLTSQNTLRKAFDHHVGLKRGECDNLEFDELKSASKILLAKLEDLPDFLEALLRVRRLPEPHYDPEQWEVLQALFSLLPLLAAHLHLVFSEHNEVDFTSVSQQALLALGDELSPTDLALYLDHHIHHILVDEFQDTSIQQFQLLNQLVHGWQPNDGKTLFVVGDPMQSIYRFRAAEVGLFLRARHQGIGSVALIPLELSCNFRSTPTIVNWVNTQFRFIFPQTDDIESGAVSFHASAPVLPDDNNIAVKAFQLTNREQEAQAIVACVIDELYTNPTDRIAILVRSRNQLKDIIRLLRKQHIPFQGVDIDLLANLAHLRDVWSLTQAMLMPANRLAWLCLLRSPWCGLSLPDILLIANFSKKKSIYYALSQSEQITGLSDEGYVRALYLYTVLNHALTQRYQQPLVDWITNTLSQLHIERILDSTQQDDLEQYWILLEQFEQDGQIADIELFKSEFNKLYSKKVAPSRLQIMTIHKSKGLEFDCVILPGLGAKPSSIDTPLIRWLKLPTPQQDDLLLLSPIKAAHQEHCILYDYLGKLDAQKNSYESQRLLYVAATRAKKRLYLFDNQSTTRQGSFRHLLQHQEFNDGLTTTEQENNVDNESHAFPALYHLPLAFYQQAPTTTFNHGNESSLIITNATPRLIGIVTHELLQWLCEHHPASLDDIPWALAKHQLITMGFEGKALLTAQEKLQQQITQFFNDPIGEWIAKAHTNEHNEYELLVDEEGDIVTRIIDRTFCEHGIRWIIDFKTGRDDTQTKSQHRQQLNEYAMLLTTPSSLPIRCGLYYLATGHWIDWEFSNQNELIRIEH